MVTSVGNSSTSILTLFRTGADGATDANSETLAKIQQLAKEAEQLKAGASAAQVQGASVATNAWIGASEAAQQAPAPPAAQTAATDAHSKRERYGYRDPIQLANGIQKYNNAIIARVELKSELVETQARLEAATNPDETARLTRRTEFLEIFSAYYEQIYTDYPSEIEESARWMNSAWNIGGTLLIKNDNGTYGLGIFFVRLKDNDGMTYYSDRNGSIWKNQRQMVAQADSWREAIVTVNGKMKYSPTYG